MRTAMRRAAWRFGAGVSLMVACCGTAFAQNAGEGGGEPVKALLLLERAELSKVLVDAKDQKLRDAFAMLPARLRDLPGEAPNMPPQAVELIDMVVSAVARPAKVAITYGAGNPAHGLWGYGIVVSMEAKDAGEAKDMHAKINAMLAQADVPQQFAPKASERVKGMADVQIPGGMGLLTYGPRESASGWRYEVIVGCLDNPDDAFAAIPKPTAGLDTVMHGRVDLEQLTPAAQFAMTMAGRQGGAEVREVFGELTKMGLIGSKAMKIDFEDGYTKTEHVSRFAVRGAKAYKDAYWLSDKPVDKSELRLIPASVTVGGISKSQLSKLNEMISQISEKAPQVTEGLERFKAETGVDLQNDVFAALGESMVFYMSDATGGGSIASSVVAVGLKDKAKFLAAHDKLLSKANEFFMHMPKGAGYVKITPWEDSGAKLFSLRCAGIPVPLEVTYAVAGDWVIASLTPQGTLAAVRQAMGKGDGGLGTNEQFAATVGNKTLSGVSFVDTGRMMRAGYPFASLLGSAVANGVRSRDGSREPGVVVPTFNELVAGAKPYVQMMSWSGDDYVIETRGDRSALVRVAGVSGTMVQFWPIIAAAIGAGKAAEHRHDLGWNDAWFTPAWATLTGNPAAMAMGSPVEQLFTHEQINRWVEGKWVEDAVEWVK